MRAFKKIKISETKTTKVENVVCVTYRKLKMISAFFCLLLCVNILGVSVEGIGVSDQIKRVTSSWSPNITDIGKLKFVNSDNKFDIEAVSEIEDFALPFENCIVQEVSAGEFSVNGLGGMVVKCCFDGKVEKVDIVDNKRKVTVQHKRGIKSVYEGMDNVGVKAGDQLKKNAPIGVSESSEITFKIFFRNRLITGLTFKDGEILFL